MYLLGYLDIIMYDGGNERMIQYNCVCIPIVCDEVCDGLGIPGKHGVCVCVCLFLFYSLQTGSKDTQQSLLPAAAGFMGRDW